MKWVLMLFMLTDKGVVQVKQVKGLPSEQICQETGKEAQRLDTKHVQSFKCFDANAAPKSK